MSLFEQFRKNKQTGYITDTVRQKKVVDISFPLSFDEKGAFIEVADKSGKPVTTDYRQYSGTLRSILKSVEQIQQKAAFAIDWENPENRIYLHVHPYLLDSLLYSGKLLNKKGNPLTADKSIAQLTVEIKPDGDGLWATTYLKGDGIHETDFYFINENHALLEDKETIIETHSAGPQFGSVYAFGSKFGKADIQKYLSLLFSYIGNRL